MKKILVVTTYPIKNPQHGGQKRASAIVTQYQKAGHDTLPVAVFFRDFYNTFSSEDIPLGDKSSALVHNSPYTGDIVCGQAIYEDPAVKRRFTKLLNSFQPDIIHIEQPFSYLGIKPLLEELNLQPIIVFGSQNIEAPMKREILEGINMEESSIEKHERIIADLERQLSREADLVVACTEDDVRAHADMGAKHIVLAKNGIAKSSFSANDEAYWRGIFAKQGITKNALFVASAHPPSWTGFFDMIGKGLGFMSYNEAIVLAGSVCDYFKSEINPKSLDIENATFWLRAFSAGRLSEQKLVSLIAHSEVMLLPITEGGGSNLKTAEAILANKKIVGTSHAFRSFEWAAELPNVWIADTKQAFQNAITEAMNAKFIKRNETQAKAADKVQWKYCLEEMVKEVAKL